MISTMASEGVTVEAHVLCRLSDTLILEITYPFSGVLIDASLPAFVSRCNSFEGTYGDDVTQFLLRSLYALCTYTRDNIATLAGPYQELQKELGELYYDGLTPNELEDKCFFKQTLFFHKWFRNMYVPQSSWDGILSLIARSADTDHRKTRQSVAASAQSAA